MKKIKSETQFLAQLGVVFAIQHKRHFFLKIGYKSRIISNESYLNTRKIFEMRLEPIEAVNKIVEEANKRIQPNGTVELFGVLRARLYDSNKNLIITTLTCISGLQSAMGHPVEKSSKGILSDVLKCLGDNKKHMRESALAALDSWVAATHLDKMVPYITTSLIDAKLGAEGRKDLFDWLSKQLTGIAGFPDAIQLLRSVAADNSVDVRKAAETFFGDIVRMTVTWTSGYGINEAEPFVEWGRIGEETRRSPAGTLTIDRNSLCGAPARTVGWRDPGFIHTGFLNGLWPNAVYTYKLGHKLINGTLIWIQVYQFKSSPYPGQDSLQRVIIFGDMGKDEADGSNDYNNYQHGSLNTTKQLIKDLKNYDIVFHIGDICYANGYLSQWDQFTAQVEPISSAVPYMVASRRVFSQISCAANRLLCGWIND